MSDCSNSPGDLGGINVVPRVFSTLRGEIPADEVVARAAASATFVHVKFLSHSADENRGLRNTQLSSIG